MDAQTAARFGIADLRNSGPESVFIQYVDCGYTYPVHIVCSGGTGATGFYGNKGVRGRTGSTGDTGATGLQVQSIHRRVARQAGCPGKLW